MKIPIDQHGLLIGYLEHGRVNIDCMEYDQEVGGEVTEKVVYSLSMTVEMFARFHSKVMMATHGIPLE